MPTMPDAPVPHADRTPAPTVHPARDEDFELLDRLLQLYLHDFSEHTGEDVDEHGRFQYAWLDAYRHEAGRHASVIRVEGRPAGFALVREAEVLHMAEFFVLRKHRRAGVGLAAARHLLEARIGPWSITQLASNPEATAFWRRAIPVPFEESVQADGTVEQRFTIEHS
jgi:predicted acetyltransferase